MAENKSQNAFDDKDKGPVDTREVNFQCLTDKDDYLGFVAKGGVILKDYKIEQGRWTWYMKCG